MQILFQRSSLTLLITCKLTKVDDSFPFVEMNSKANFLDGFTGLDR